MTPLRQSFKGQGTLASVFWTLASMLVLAVLLQSQPRASESRAPHPQAAQSEGQSIRFTTLPDFTIERLVPTSKTDSYVVMTFDSLGRLVVSKEYDHPRLLLDSDGDGIYESEKVITDKVKNCQGLWFDGRTLYGDCAPSEGPSQGPAAAGGGPNAAPQTSGLFKMTDTDGDDVTDTFEKVNDYVGGIQEHGPHAIRRGPDGSLTLITGNNTFIPDEMIDPASPIAGAKESQFLPALPDGRGFGPSVKEGWHGTIERLHADQKQYSLIVGGLRNAYDFAFNREGELFTFDSDMEWDINMPWYRDVRSVHAIPGGNYGYRNGSGKFPPYFIDSLPNMRDLGRGSPVGVEFYEHRAYPAQFDNAYFEADWSRGRLLWTALKREGATYKAVEEKTEFVHGEPLNITDVETGPDGMIYFTTGGRGTEGGVYRVRYTGHDVPMVKLPAILGLVRQPQPLSSWGWAKLEETKKAMGAAWAADLEKLARDTSARGEDRAQAIYLLQQHGPAPSADLLTALIADANVDVRSAVVFVAGAQEANGPKAVVATALKDKDPWVQRRAAEALVRMGLSKDKPALAPVADIYALLDSPDRFVRWSGRLALQRTPRAEWQALAEKETGAGQYDAMLALIETSSSDADLAPIFKKQLALMAKPSPSVDDTLRLVRTFQLAVLSAQTLPADLKKQVNAALIGQFPAKDERLSRQLASTLAWAGQPAAIGKILAAMPEGDTNQQLQLHYAYALRTMKDGWTPAQKTKMTDFYAKAVNWRGGASFPGFINLLFDASLETFTDDEKKVAYQKVPQFAPLTEAEIAAAAQRMAAMRAGAAQGGRPRGPVANARARGVAAISREEILQEQIFTPLRQPPSVPAGQGTFEKVCAQCHRFGAMGSDVGPDLTTLNSRFKKKDIVEAILWPSRTISDQYEMTMVETKDGKSFGGFVVREDAQKLTMRTADASARSFDIPKANIKSRQKSPVSLMPEGLIDDYSQQDIASLIAFLQSAPPQ